MKTTRYGILRYLVGEVPLTRRISNLFRVTLALAIALSMSDAYAKAKPKAASATSMEAYEDSGKRFSISLPKGWEQRQDAMGAAVIALRPMDNKKDSFRENVNVVVEPLNTKMTAKQYFDASQAVLAKAFTEFHLEKKGHSTIDSHDYYWSIFTHRLGTTRAKVLQYMTVDAKNGFVITGSALPATFPKFLPQFETIAKSFRIKHSDLTKS